MPEEQISVETRLRAMALDIEAINSCLKNIIEIKLPKVTGMQKWVLGILSILTLIFGASFLFASWADNQLVERAKTKHIGMEKITNMNTGHIKGLKGELTTLALEVNKMAKHQANLEGRTSAELKAATKGLDENNQLLRALLQQGSKKFKVSKKGDNE